MTCERPDSRFYEDLSDLNREFLGLITFPRSNCPQRVLGLDSVSVELLRSLADDELSFIANTPCLLPEFVAPESGVNEPRLSFAEHDAAWAEAVQMFSVALLSFLRATMGRDRLLAALCVGPEQTTLARFAQVSLGGIRHHASSVSPHLQARFANVPSFWPDLIRAARSEDTEFRHLSRLTAIPLVVAPRAYRTKQTI